MNKTTSIIVSLCFVIFTTGLALAVAQSIGILDDAYAVMGGRSIDIKVKKIFTGNVKEIDINAMIITVIRKVNDREVKIVFTINNNTSIIIGTEKKTIADVKIGDKVAVTYTKADSQNIANGITIEK